MANYNVMRSVEELLTQYESSPPSFSIHLHREHWNMNNSHKFLYHGQPASLLDDIRAQRIPVDFIELFDAAGLPFYDGCMIVELLDYRPLKSKDSELADPERSRVVLRPNSETLWSDICLLNQKAGYTWTDQEALEVEARILVATAPPLCLDPDPHLTRVANSVLRISMPKTPPSLKRKAAAIEQEEEENEKARRIKISQYMNPRNNRSTAPTYRILDIKKLMDERKYKPSPTPESKPLASTPVTNGPNPSVGINPSALQGAAHPGLPTILPGSSSGVPAPPTAATLTHGQPPTGVRQSPRPPSTVPPATAIPPHMQHLYPRSTPPPVAQLQRPPSAAAAVQGSPIPRPPSITHTPQPQPAPSAPQPQSSAAPRPQFQGLTPQQIHQVNQQKSIVHNLMNGKPEILVHFVETDPKFKILLPQLQKALQDHASRIKSGNSGLLNAQQQHAAQAARAATPAQNGTQTAVPTVQQQASHPPRQTQFSPHPPQQRNSPLPTNQTVAARSPMPANAHAAPHMSPQATPQRTPQIAPQMAHLQPAQAYAGYPMAHVQGQFNNSQLRVMGTPHAQMMANLANGNPQAAAAAAAMMAQQGQPGQDQHVGAQMITPQMSPAFMYNYAQMGANMQHGRVQQYAWPVNMLQQQQQQQQQQKQQQQQQQQQQMQQMQMGSGKTGMQGT